MSGEDSKEGGEEDFKWTREEIEELNQVRDELIRKDPNTFKRIWLQEWDLEAEDEWRASREGARDGASGAVTGRLPDQLHANDKTRQSEAHRRGYDPFKRRR